MGSGRRGISFNKSISASSSDSIGNGSDGLEVKDIRQSGDNAISIHEQNAPPKSSEMRVRKVTLCDS